MTFLCVVLQMKTNGLNLLKLKNSLKKSNFLFFASLCKLPSMNQFVVCQDLLVKNACLLASCLSFSYQQTKLPQLGTKKVRVNALALCWRIKPSLELVRPCSGESPLCLSTPGLLSGRCFTAEQLQAPQSSDALTGDFLYFARICTEQWSLLTSCDNTEQLAEFGNKELIPIHTTPCII